MGVARPVTWDGQHYPSIKAAAEATGRSPQGMHHLIVSAGCHGEKDVQRCGGGGSVPVRLDGVLYSSFSACRRATGRTYYDIRKSLAEDSPIKIDGTIYESARDAAEKLGVSVKLAMKMRD